MFTFGFIANAKEDRAALEQILQSSKSITKKWMPSLGTEISEGCTILPESNCGWFWLGSASLSRRYPFISEAVEARYAVLAFGEVFDLGGQQPAEIILNAWQTGGGAKVRGLEGNYSAVIVDRSTGAISLIGDPIGQRNLRYHADNQMLIVSPHDIPLVATGYCPIEFDYVSAYSMASVQWSLLGQSLLKHVNFCHPSEYVQWFNGECHCVTDPIVNSSQRIDRDDSEAIAQNLDQMIETAQAGLSAMVVNEPEVEATLSAGLDSRAVLSLLLSIRDPSQIVAVSSGDADSLDVQVARQIAKLNGVRFCRQEHTPAKPDNFVAHSDLIAFFLNGDCPEMFSLFPLPEINPSANLAFFGDGGEIFRGYYYPNVGSSFSFHPNLSISDVTQAMRKKTRIDRLPWKSSDFKTEIDARFESAIGKYAAFSTDGYDILDMWYLYERTAVWGTRRAGQTWNLHYRRPLESGQLAKLAYRMPAPIRKYARLQQESIHRFMPNAYGVRINGITLLPLEREGKIPDLMRKADLRYIRTLFRIKRRSKRAINHILGKSYGRDYNQIAVDALAGPLMDTARDILMSERGISRQIFEKQNIDLFFDEIKSQKRRNACVLVSLITMERWCSLVRAVASDAGGEAH